MEEKYVYIDETGDIGLTNKSRPYFIMCGVVATKKVSEKIDINLTKIKESLNWGRNAELKFSKTKKEIIILSLKNIRDLNFKIYYVIYNKKTPLDIRKGKSAYNTIMLALLKCINAKVLNVTVDGGFGRKYTRKTRTFIRKNLPEKTIKNSLTQTL
ncbi:DUF3800 domain-containing protein [Candidatus Saccharibacteria bacterium]|nr:DUF3800 domain-containing protein [Candidatus Saccharibacteria bacterium]